MGISFDEMQRMKINQLKYIQNQYPLVEKAIRRKRCIEWMEENNFPKPPRSACTFCPYHSNEEWRKIKENKEEWEEVVKLDKMISDIHYNRLSRATLGGCIIEKVSQSVIIVREH